MMTSTSMVNNSRILSNSAYLAFARKIMALPESGGVGSPLARTPMPITHATPLISLRCVCQIFMWSVLSVQVLRSRRAVLTTTLIVVLFSVCWMPYCLFESLL